MKNRLFIAMCLGIAIVACHKENSENAPSPAHTHSTKRLTTSEVMDTLSSAFITPAVANTMISSYLYSINSSVNDTDIHSISVNADSLRALLSNTSITNVKLIFAHSLNYINAGNTGQYAGYQAGALTIIIAAYDNSGNYVYYNGNVLDHLAPCPYTCPIGNASNDYLE